MKFRKVIIGVGLFLSTINYQQSTVFAQSHQKAGTTGAQILEVKPGTRPAAMGGAFVAISDDANALNYNPAGLAFLKDKELQLNQNNYYGEAIVSNINGVYPLSEAHAKDVYDLGVIAGGFTYVNYGKLAGRDATGADTGEFGAQDRVITVGYGTSFSPNYSLGVTGTEIRQEIFGLEAKGYSFNAGFLVKGLLDNILNIGLAAQNMGSKIGFENEKQSLPTNIVLGGALNLANDRLIFTADLNKPVNDYYYWRMGSEFLLTKILALRIGYNTKHDAGNGLSGGVGIVLHEFDYAFVPFSELAINYAYVPYGDLGVDHRIELVIKMGVE